MDNDRLTIPELIIAKSNVDRVAFVFDSETITLTFNKVRTEVWFEHKKIFNKKIKISSLLITG